MQNFLARHQSEVKGVLSGWDRIRFRGTNRHISHWAGMMQLLSLLSVLLKDFSVWAQSLTDQLRCATEKLAKDASRPIRYLYSSQIRKEDLVREIAEKDGITEGLIVVLSCVEPCYTWHVRKDRDAQKLKLEQFSGKCLHYYFYYQHPQFGLMHVRLQSWLPFTVNICINGREWLAQDLTRIKMPFEKRDNCFVDLADVPRAQQIFDMQLQTDWISTLSSMLDMVHPTHSQLFGRWTVPYYWSTDESEWATDVMFRSPDVLAKYYPPFVRYGITTFGPGDVMRFFGRRPLVKMLTTGTVESHLGTRAEGVRIKHQLEGNSVKMYDKQGSVLRVETTINNPAVITVQRGTEKEPLKVQPRKMRKGVADMARRANASQSVNERYLDSMAAVTQEEPLQQTIAPLCQPTELNGRRVRALSPLSQNDGKLLATIGQSEFILHGFRNQDLRTILFQDDSTRTAKQKSGKVTRLFRLLRAHGLIRKVPKSHRYQVTAQGRLQITAILAAQHANTKELVQMAA